MTKRKNRRVVLNDFKAKKAEEGSIEIEVEGGKVFTIPPPELWPDEVAEAAKRNDTVASAAALLGDEAEYEAFKSAGGSATLLWSIIQDELGADVGESPASSISS